MRKKPFILFIRKHVGGHVSLFNLRGRYSQALQALIEAGDKDVTAAEVSSWALRLSHYVHILRRDHNLDIEMQLERHGPPYEGQHGRYFLRSNVRLPVIEASATIVSDSERVGGAA